MDTILVPTDGSTNAEAAVEHAVSLAERIDATVYGLFAVYVSSVDHLEGGIDIGSLHDSMEKLGDEALSVVSDRCEAAGVDCTTEIRSGRPSREILDYAAELDADLVVMGTQGRRGLSRVLLGSVTEAVLKKADVPVLAVPRGVAVTDGYRDILIATDGSDSSRHAVESGIDLARRLDASIHALYVVDSGLTQSQIIYSALETEGTAAVTFVERTAEAADLDVRTAIEDGTPHEKICSYADENGVDLIVIGSHGRGAIDRALLGSVSERTVRTANQPVLVVRSPEAVE